jgi:hypothetical protein
MSLLFRGKLPHSYSLYVCDATYMAVLIRILNHPLASDTCVATFVVIAYATVIGEVRGSVKNAERGWSS